MLQGWVIVMVAVAYLGLLFAIAYFADKRSDAGRSVIANPYIYALSLAVYATSWTFYGSVGRAAADGVGFLPIYIGPTLGVVLWWLVLRKIIRISKVNRITSIADFIGARYGKSQILGGVVTVIAIIGITPYISLQLKAAATSFNILLSYPVLSVPPPAASIPFLRDTAFYVAMSLAAFTILFGTRHLDAAERHEGMVAAIAFESLVKLVAFIAVGVFVTWGIYSGFGDITAKAAEVPKIAALFTPFSGVGPTYASWIGLTVLSMLAVVLLPRQFQVAVVENVNENHLKKAIWLFPLYMLAINFFVLPIAFGGLLHFAPGRVDADTYVLALPMAEKQELLTLLVFIGGLSAAAGMVVVETIALSTMVCNDLVMPLALRIKALRLAERADLTGLLLTIRRGAIVLILLLGYLYFRFAGEAYALVSIGLISFAAVAQFAPALFGGLYWRDATRQGAMWGLSLGFLVWAYTLMLPAIVRSGWLPGSILTDGPFGIAGLKPLELFGLTGLDQITHALIWSMMANIGAYILASMMTRPSVIEQAQASRFVDAFKLTGVHGAAPLWRGSASLAELKSLVSRFLGPARAKEVFETLATERDLDSVNDLEVDADLVHAVERQLAGTIGAASARIMVSSVVKEEVVGIDDVMGMLDEASQAIAYSHELEEKSRELEAATRELQAANERLKELDRMKDDFVSMVSHELRTPLTSIRAFSEILQENPDLDPAERQRFLGIIIKESERLTRLINQVLDLAKIESGRAEWHVGAVDLVQLLRNAADTTASIFQEKGVDLALELPEHAVGVTADEDRLTQVAINLLSNAVKFCPAQFGRVTVRLFQEGPVARVDVCDNGPGVKLADRELIFEKFRQAGDNMTGKPHGTGLGLPISRQIMTHLGGHLWVGDAPQGGAMFSFTLPLAQAATDAAKEWPHDQESAHC